MLYEVVYEQSILPYSVSQGHWWTGGNDIDKDDDFIWDNSGQTFSTTYADWLTGTSFYD